MNTKAQAFPRHILTMFFALQLSGLAIANAQPTLVHNADVNALIQQLQTGSADEKLSAAEHLGDFGPYAYRAVPALATMLADEDPALAYESLIALSSIGPLATSSNNDVAVLLNSQFVPLRVASLDTLRHIGSAPADSIALIQSLAADSNPAVMVAAVRCLVTLDRPDSKEVASAVPHLVTSLTSPRSSVRNAAASALNEIGDSVVSALKFGLQSSEPVGRSLACEVAGRLGSAASELIPVLQQRLDDHDDVVVQSAAIALGRIGGQADSVVPNLERLLDSDSAAIRTAALSGLMSFGPLAHNAVPGVCRLTKDRQSIVRAAAVRTLGAIGVSSQPALDCLVNAIEDVHGGVTIQAANALSQLGADAVPALLLLLQKTDFQELAVSVLGELGANAKSAVPALVELLKTDDAALRREAFIALAMIGPDAKAAVPELLTILDNQDAGLKRAGAAYVLANIGEQSCLPVLKAILADDAESDQATKRAVAWALVTLEPASPENATIALSYLTMALSSEVALVRKEALSAIGKLGAAGQPAAEALFELAQNDTDPAVRGAALHALAMLPKISDSVLPIAVAAMKDDNPQVSNAACFLLGQLGPRAGVAASGLQQRLRTGAELGQIVSAWALVRVQPSPDHGQKAVPFMVKALDYPNPRMRAEAARTLGVIGINSSDVMSALKVAATDEDSDVKLAATTALKKLQ